MDAKVQHQPNSLVATEMDLEIQNVQVGLVVDYLA